MTMETDIRLKPRPMPEWPLGRWLWRNRWSVTDLANAIGVDKSVISRVANGETCSRDVEARIKRATGLKQI